MCERVLCVSFIIIFEFAVVVLLIVSLSHHLCAFLCIFMYTVVLSENLRCDFSLLFSFSFSFVSLLFNSKSLYFYHSSYKYSS